MRVPRQNHIPLSSAVYCSKTHVTKSPPQPLLGARSVAVVHPRWAAVTTGRRQNSLRLAKQAVRIKHQLPVPSSPRPGRPPFRCPSVWLSTSHKQNRSICP